MESDTLMLWAVEVLYAGVWLESSVRRTAAEAFAVACGRRFGSLPTRVGLHRYQVKPGRFGSTLARVA